MNCLGEDGNGRVVDTLRLANGILFSMPITLDVSAEEVKKLNLAPGSRVTLRDSRDEQPLAIITGMKILSPI